LFPVMYCQIVEGARPDVLIANPYGYPIEAAYRDMPNDVTSAFAVRPTIEDEKLIFSWLVHHSGRPVYSSVQRTGPDIRSANAGLLFRYVPRGQPARREDPWPDYSWHTVDERIAENDWSAEIILFEYYFALGRMHLDEGEYDQGVAAFERAARFARENKDGLNNLGATAARYGLYAEAVHYLDLSAALDSRWTVPRLNLARAHLRFGETDRAMAQLEEVLRIEPENEAALRLRARIEREDAVEGQGPARDS
jgi:tetratricopeptide (TPR) repeat protein